MNFNNNNYAFVAVVSVLLAAASQNAFAHTRLTVPVAPESSAAHGTTTTAVNIPHGCGDNSVIGNVFFLPDTNSATVQTSTNGFETFEAPEGDNALNYIVNPPFVRIIKSKDLIKSTQNLSMILWAIHWDSGLRAVNYRHLTGSVNCLLISPQWPFNQNPAPIKLSLFQP